MFNLDFFRKAVYTNFTKKNVIFLAAPEIKIVNQIVFVIQKWPKEWHGYAKNYLKIFLLLYILRKQKKIKAYIKIKPEFELQKCFTAETKNDIIS